MAKPTPTQDELDRAAMGEHVVEKEYDGSRPDIAAMPDEPVPEGDPPVMTHHRHMEAKPSAGAGYQTRQATAQPTPPQPQPSPPPPPPPKPKPPAES